MDIKSCVIKRCAEPASVKIVKRSALDSNGVTACTLHYSNIITLLRRFGVDTEHKPFVPRAMCESTACSLYAEFKVEVVGHRKKDMCTIHKDRMMKLVQDFDMSAMCVPIYNED